MTRSEGRNLQTVTQAEIEPDLLQVEGPVALDFYQASCPPCRALEPRLARVAGEYQGRLPVYRVDLDRDLPVAACFRVMSIPTILIFRGGQEVARLDGLITESALRRAFDRALGLTAHRSSFPRVAPLDSVAATDPTVSA